MGPWSPGTTHGTPMPGRLTAGTAPAARSAARGTYPGAGRTGPLGFVVPVAPGLRSGAVVPRVSRSDTVRSLGAV